MPRSEHKAKEMFLAVFDTLCGVSVCGRIDKGEGLSSKPDLYKYRHQWWYIQADFIEQQVHEVRRGTRAPNECGTDEELRAVWVYPDGRIIDRGDGVTDYKALFDRDNYSLSHNL